MIAQLDMFRGEMRIKMGSTPSLHHPSAGKISQTPSLYHAVSAIDMKQLHIARLYESKEVKFKLEDNVNHKYVTEQTPIRL